MYIDCAAHGGQLKENTYVMVIRGVVCHSKSLTELVSRLCMSVRMKPISFLVFSKITFGSFDRHRKQFGAMTIARLFTSIFVTDAFSGFANSWNTDRNFFNQVLSNNQTLVLTALLLGSTDFLLAYIQRCQWGLLELQPLLPLAFSTQQRWTPCSLQEIDFRKLKIDFFFI